MADCIFAVSFTIRERGIAAEFSNDTKKLSILQADSEYAFQQKDLEAFWGKYGVNTAINLSKVNSQSGVELYSNKSNYFDAGEDGNFGVWLREDQYDSWKKTNEDLFYYKGKYYAGGIGAIITVFGNEQLKWEKTRSWDINLETEFLKGAISARFSYYNKLTNNLLADVTLPQSSGFTSYRANIGKMENSGYEINLRAFPIRNKDLNISIFGSLAHNKNIIKEISNSLKARNEEIDKEQDNYNPEYNEPSLRPQVQFKEGESTTTIYAVRSLGINPANGKEVFINRFGNPTYQWSAADKVACGDTAPTIQGSFGANADWKGFNLNLSFLYEYGGQIYNQTLVDRVENANLTYNADKRVLYDRWKQPGDIALYKDIRDNSRTELTSRMIQDNNILNFKSLSLSYTFPSELTKKFYMERVKLTFLVEDLYYWSTVKRERGLDYPYSHSYNFGLQVQF